MCAPSNSSPSQAPTPTPAPKSVSESEARRTGKTLRQSSPSQRGRGVLIRSNSPLGISTTNSNLGTRQSLLVPINPQAVPSFSVNVGGY
jgi:hypothetical protein